MLAALAGTNVPHPALIAAEPDVDVLGAAFYLMAPVDGMNVRLELPERDRTDPTWQRALGFAMVDGLVAIAEVDVEAAGLSDLGRSDGWIERQVTTWQRQYDGYRTLAGYGRPRSTVSRSYVHGSLRPVHRQVAPDSFTATSTSPT